MGACIPVTALTRGVSHRYLRGSDPDWRTAGHVTVRDGMLCGTKEGAGRVRAGIGGVWSQELEVRSLYGLVTALTKSVSHRYLRGTVRKGMFCGPDQ